MKSVLISIKPKYCELIASGKKTIEVRKTKPKLEMPFKCYIYCTANKGVNDLLEIHSADGKIRRGNSKVIGEFVCDCMYGISNFLPYDDEPHHSVLPCVLEQTCLEDYEIDEYLGKKDGYGWNISDLKIYDKPKELGEYGEFYVWKKCNSCRDTGYESTACCYDIDCKVPAIISRPPQSWCYVED